MNDSAYSPYRPARRPGNRPVESPRYRVLVHKSYIGLYDQLARRVGIQQAQQFWDHLCTRPGSPCEVASITILRGKTGKLKAPGWSRTYHFEISSMARANYQFNDDYKTVFDGDSHRVVFILTLNFSSH
jgi:hypothetical protein